MNGIKIVRAGRSVDSARPQDIILSSELETLPIKYEGEFELWVIPAQGFGLFGFSKTRVVHGLGYPPLVLAWIDVPVGSEIRRSKIPYYVEGENFIYEAIADEDNAYITATSGVIDPSGSSFKRTGYIRVFEKDMTGL